jgi:hypothetical protein
VRRVCVVLLAASVLVRFSAYDAPEREVMRPRVEPHPLLALLLILLHNLCAAPRRDGGGR